MKRVTISDVASHAGVGKGTVSSVLNGQSAVARISEETQKRVIEAANELNYRPNAIARMLVQQKTDILAVVFQRGYFFTSWSSFTAEVMRGVSTAAVELGYDLMLHTKDVSPELEAKVLADGRVDGALVLRDDADSMVDELIRHRFPCVRFFSRGAEGAPYIDADNVLGGKIATKHLIDLGHARIGMVRGSEHSTSSNDRLAGYRQAMHEAGLEAKLDWELSIPSALSGLSTLRKVMTSPNRPTALFVWSDDVALACLTVLHELGLQVPNDVSVIGFDSLDVCNRSVPPLTSIRQPVFEMAQQATHLLVALIRGQEIADRQILCPLELDLRASTAPCPSILSRGNQ